MNHSAFKRILRSMYLEDNRVVTVSMVGLTAVFALMILMMSYSL